MYPKYKFELVRGEDKSIPFTFFYRYPHTRKQEAVRLDGLSFLMRIKAWHTDEEIARLTTENGDILVGNLVDLDFVEAGEGEEATAVLVNIDHTITEVIEGNRAVFDLFAISKGEDDETRQCVVVGEIKVLRGFDYV